jgi:hypothetical protein
MKKDVNKLSDGVKEMEINKLEKILVNVVMVEYKKENEEGKMIVRK